MTATATPSAQVLLTQELEQRVQNALGLPSKAAAKRTVNAVLDGLIAIMTDNAATEGFSFRLQGIGTLSTSKIGAKAGRNPKTGEKVVIPACFRMRLKVSKSILDLGKNK